MRVDGGCVGVDGGCLGNDGGSVGVYVRSEL